ncbi:ABC transporter substrate-binding protein [Nocardioides nanhaiensis]|uniref:ABC transporter substrate-binding protein n=1 Tax=Nocardioides nanhaiensis TaxID=1476871 RepID=A0ABP8WYD3_9ACTN
MAGTAALSLTLAACGGSEDTNEADEPAASESTSESSDAGAEPTNDVCEGSATSADTFKVGGILPITGNLAFLGPPEIAAVGLAVSDINAAGGVNGAQACHQIEDSGDSTDLSIVQASARGLVRGTPSVVIGAASSSVSEAVVDTFTDAQVTQVSPANTAVALSGISPFYFRTAPPDGVQGSALGTLISQDGFQNIAFIVFNDTYGTGLRDVVEETVTASGGSCVYGCKGDGNEFPAGQTTFTSEVADAIAAGPDAIVVLAFDETKAIVPELDAQGWDMANTYFTDGNTSDYSEDLPAGIMTGAQGTIPGADASQDFKDRVSQWYEVAEGESLNDYSYSAESYDATILAALAAAKGGSNDSATVQENFAAVSGATDGEECSTFEECLTLIDEGSEIRYVGPSGIGPINDQNDPSSAFVGIYQYLEDNSYELTSTVEGTS